MSTFTSGFPNPAEKPIKNIPESDLLGFEYSRSLIDDSVIDANELVLQVIDDLTEIQNLTLKVIPDSIDGNSELVHQIIDDLAEIQALTNDVIEDFLPAPSEETSIPIPEDSLNDLEPLDSEETPTPEEIHPVNDLEPLDSEEIPISKEISIPVDDLEPLYSEETPTPEEIHPVDELEPLDSEEIPISEEIHPVNDLEPLDSEEIPILKEISIPEWNAIDAMVQEILKSHPTLKFHPTAQACLEQELQRMVSRVAQFPTSESILAWTQTLPELVRVEILAPPLVETALPRSEINRILLKTMRSHLTEGLEYVMMALYDQTVLPWDIYSSLRPDWAHVLGLPSHPKLELEVNITLPASDSEIVKMNRETLLGLLWYVKHSNHSIEASIYGHPITYFESTRYSASDLRYPTYELTFNQSKYQFSDPDFGRGIRTGAIWMGDDFHRYILDLKFHPDPSSSPIPQVLA